MQIYYRLLGTIILLFVSIANIYFIKIEFKRLAAYIASMVIVSSLAVTIFGEISSIIAAMLIAIIFIYAECRSIISSIAIPIMSVIICIVFDSLISNIYISISKANLEILSKNNGFYCKVYLIEFLFVFLTSKIIGIILNKKSKVIFLEIKGVLGVIIIISLILTLAIFYVNLGIGWSNSYNKITIRINGIIFFVYSILLIIIVYVLIHGVKNEIVAKNKQDQLEQMQDYTRNLEKVYNDMRIFRHDYINILSSMMGYIENKDIDGLEKFFLKEIIPLGNVMESNEFKIGRLKNITVPELKGLISYKLIKAQELGIEIYIDIIEELNDICIDMVDISRILGIFLDNAIEAAEVCINPFIKLGIIKKESSILIVITNSCNNDVPPIFKLYQAGFSTKGSNRGLGLSGAKSILNKYHNVFSDTIVENGEFTQTIEIINN